MTAPEKLAEKRYQMGVICEQAGIKDEQELMDLIGIGMRAKYRLGLVGDVLENLRVDLQSAQHVVGGIIR